MEKIYSRDNCNVSYKRFSKMKRKPGRPPACSNNDPPFRCFVCDEKITRQKVNLLLGTSSNRNGFPSQMSQLLGDEFLIIVQDDDYLCKQCVNLFNNMDKLEKQLTNVKDTLIYYLKKKYNLINSNDCIVINPDNDNESLKNEGVIIKKAKTEYVENEHATDENIDEEDDEIVKQLNDLYSSSKNDDKLSFNNNNNNNNDSTKNNAVTILKCNVCDFKFNDRNIYDRHVREHINNAIETEYNSNDDDDDDNDDINDDDVEKIYNRCSLTTEPSSLKLFKCSICNRVFLTKLKCLDHMKFTHVYNVKDVKVNDNGSQNGAAVNCHRKNNDEIFNDLLKSNNNSNGSFNSSKQNCSDQNDLQRTDMKCDANNKGKEKNASSKGLNTDSGVVDVHTDEEDDDIGAGDVEYSDEDVDDLEDESDEDDYESDAEYDESSDLEPMKHTCGNCGFKGDLITLREHLFEKRTQRDLTCGICKQSFNSFCKLMKHSSEHDTTNSKPIECIYCDVDPITSERKLLPDILSLNYHMKRIHLSLINEKVCNICNKKYPNLDYIEYHIVNKFCGYNETTDENTRLTTENNNNNATDNKDSIIKEDLSEVKMDTEQITDSKISDENLIQTSVENFNGTDVTIDFQECLTNGDNVTTKMDTDIFPEQQGTVAEPPLQSQQLTTSVPEEIYKCSECEYRTNCREELVLHFETHRNVDDNDSSTVCKLCDIKFIDNVRLKSHEIRHVNKSLNLMCPYCNANDIYDNLNLKYHVIRNHSYNIAKLFCDMCDLQFDSVLNFRRHLILNHKKRESFSCRKCNRNFNFKWKLIRHYRNVHRDEFKCNFCGLIYDDINKFNKHKRLHFKRRKKCLNSSLFDCDVCKKRFGRISSLNLHKLRHNINLNLFCKFCELSFNDIGDFDHHVKTNHNDCNDLFVCEFCDENFKFYDKFKIHLLHRKCYDYNSNNNNKLWLKFECNLCRLKFSSASLRALHKRRLHFDVRNKKLTTVFRLTCAICNAFVTDDLRRYKQHMSTHIKKCNKYFCKLCTKFYSNKRKFIVHKFTIHNNRKKKKYLRSGFKRFFSGSSCSSSSKNNDKQIKNNFTENVNNVINDSNSQQCYQPVHDDTNMIR